MKRLSKRFFALFLSLALVIGMVPATFAEDKADVSVEVITDKESYEVGEKAAVTVKVTNNTDKSISDVKVEIALPGGLELAEGYSKEYTIASIAAGASDEVKAEANAVKAPYTGDSTMVFPFMLLAIAAVAVILFAKSKKMRNVANIGALLLVVGIAGLAVPVAVEAASGEVTAKKEVKVDGKVAEIIAKVTYTIGASDATDDKEEDKDNTTGETVKHVTVHDPSIVKDPETGMYYIFGSHMAWAKSEDLINWTTFTNNINKDYKTLFADAAEWSALGGPQKDANGKLKDVYDVSGNLWAPDVVYNEAMDKWCMYMSVNGDYWYTSVVMLTADSLEGDWTVVGPVVYSGFTSKAEAEKTDFYDVYSGTDFPERYNQNRNGNHTYGMNAIDPGVFYDEDGKLWMIYGSWFGGLYMIELDPATGMRLASHKYETIDNTSDEYQGIKIAGGNHVSGEAPYIEYNDGYYYLYVTLGGLTANGGYNIRVFRSEDVTGPYVDLSGNDARYTSARDNVNYTIGNRVMSYYKWDYMDYGYAAQGHNSALLDDDGKMYVIYHTRFDNQGEGHQVRVHQQFVNEDGWLVTAPFEYYNETLAEVDAADVVGPYSVLVHKLNIDYANKECVETVSIALNEDGTITGALTGTWEFGADGAPYVTMKIGNYTYKGVFIEQKMEESTTRTMTFTVLGDDEINIWGYRLAGADEELAQEAADALTMPIGAMADMTLPTNGLNATTITWESSDTDIITNDGKVTRPAADTVVTMTASVSYGEAAIEKEFPVKVFAEYDTTEDKVIWTYAEDGIDLTQAVQGTYQYQNPFNSANVTGISLYDGVSIKFHVKATGTTRAWQREIMSFNTNADGGLWVNDYAYLGYNRGDGDNYFDANMINGSYKNAWNNGTNFIGDEADVEIKITASGVEYYVDGELAYSTADLVAPGENLDATGDEVPGVTSMSSYMNTLDYLNNVATVFNLGWGSYWGDGFQGVISDVELILLGSPEVDLKGNLYLEEFVSSTPIFTEWTSHGQGTLSAEYTEANGYYLKYYVSGVSGNRCVFNKFAAEYQLEKNYTIEADIMLNSGYNRSTDFAIYGTDANKVATAGDDSVTSGYIFKMSLPSGSTTATIEGTTETVNIPASTWVHVKFTVNDAGKVMATIGDATFLLDVNGSGQLGGIFAKCARSNGLFAIDNIKLNHATDEELAAFDEAEKDEVVEEKEYKYTDLVNYDFTNSNVPTGVTLGGANAETSAVATADGIKLTDGYIVLPSTLFSELPDDADKLAVEITFTKQQNTIGNEWSERLFNFTDDDNTTDGVQTGTNGLYLSFNGNVGTTKNPYINETSKAYMDGALSGTYAIGYNTKTTVKMELDFATNTVSLYLNDELVKSATTTADAITVEDLQKYTINSIGRAADMWAMWSFMTVESFNVSYAKEVKYTDLVNYDFTNSNVPAGLTLGGANAETSAVATADGIKLTDGYIVLPSTLFSELPDDADKLAVEITFTKQQNTIGNEWSERLFNFTDDDNTTDGVQTGTNGLYLSFNGNVGTTKNPYINETSKAYMDGALSGKYAIGYNTKTTVKMELDFATNTVSLYLNDELVKSATTTADAITVEDLQKYTINSIGRAADMWAMWSFMTVENFTVSYK